MKKATSLFLSLLIALVYLYINNNKQVFNSNAGSSVSVSTPRVLGQQTQSNGCVANTALPNTACTPGAIIQSATKDQICVQGYSKSVRNVPVQLKDQVYAEYGISSHSPGQYEIDHLISLELGGSNDISNLWPESSEPRPGFHEKDMLENYLHSQVCNGSITLQQAQKEISTNWLQVYNQIPK